MSLHEAGREPHRTRRLRFEIYIAILHAGLSGTEMCRTCSLALATESTVASQLYDVLVCFESFDKVLC